MKKKINSKLGHLLIFLSLASSGNVELRQFKLIHLFLAVVVVLLTFRFIRKEFKRKYFAIVAILSFLFLIQIVVLGSTNYLGVLNTYVKIFIAGTVVYINREFFIARLLNVLYVLSIISLLFFSFDVIVQGIQNYVPAPNTLHDRFYYFFYHARTDWHNGLMRNSGMFWEPGVFSNYLVLCTAFVLPWYNHLSKSQKKKLYLIIIALLSTFSTTGYLTIGLVIISKFLLANRLKFSHLLGLGIFFLFAAFVYNSSNFLHDKIEKQTESALESDGEFNKTRLGSLLFDIHYIKKHPIVGNGLHVKTRYADHPHLQRFHEEVGHGNGFSQFIVSYGLLFAFLFFYLLYKKINMIYRHRLFAISFVFIFILNLMGEPLMNYPFYWGLIFIYSYQSLRPPELTYEVRISRNYTKGNLLVQ